MNLLAPLGLLGLLSIAVLILIYILKPNYQQKLISSTHVWKLSLKYKKKRIPISRFRNILLIICQILILTSLAFILAKPVIPGEKLKDDEKVFIIDASASMLVESGLETRFERAVLQIKSEVKETLENGGTVSVIIADEEPYFVVQRSTSADLAVVSDKLDELIMVDAMKCSYNSADMDKAVELAQDVVTQNPEAEVLLYTATTYLDKGNIEVVDVGAFEDWNAAVLGCEAVIGDDNYYTISIDVGCYGRSETVKVYCEIVSPNGEYNTSVTLESDEEFFNVMEQEKTFVFNAEAQRDQLGYAIYSFEYLYVHVEETDGFAEDNSFYLYGGIKEKVRIQYASSAPNNFFSSGFITLREIYKNTWDIDFDEVVIDPQKKENEQEYELEGYNLYIFEHTMPSILPDDGIVLLVDPDTEPKNVGLRLGGAQYVYANSTLTRGNDHPLLSYITPEQITISKYTRIISNDGYDELMYYGNEPVVLAKNESDMKVVVMALDLNFSNLAVLFDFPAFLYNHASWRS